MENGPVCIICGATLPTSENSSENSIKCIFCNQINANPNFYLDKEGNRKIDRNYYADNSEEGKPITIKTSAISQLIAAVLLVLTIFYVIYRPYGNQNKIIYLVGSLVAILPAVRLYFVPAYWEKIAKDQSEKGLEKYYISTEISLVEVLCGLVSFFLATHYYRSLLYQLFNQLLPSIHTDPVLLIIVAIFTSIATIFLVYTKILEVIGNTLGHTFSRKP